MADVLFAHLYPVFHLVVGGNIIIEHHASAVVVTIAEHIAAESTLSAATLCLDKIKMTFLEGNILLPYLRIQVVAALLALSYRNSVWNPRNWLLHRKNFPKNLILR